jgi:hypothetical protein
MMTCHLNLGLVEIWLEIARGRTSTRPIRLCWIGSRARTERLRQRLIRTIARRMAENSIQ